MDVARKLTILAREAGRSLEISDFAIESLVPDDLIDVKIDEFLEKLKEYDSVMQDRYETAKNNNLTLRYIASIDIDNNIFIDEILMWFPEPYEKQINDKDYSSSVR